MYTISTCKVPKKYFIEETINCNNTDLLILLLIQLKQFWSHHLKTYISLVCTRMSGIESSMKDPHLYFITVIYGMGILAYIEEKHTYTASWSDKVGKEKVNGLGVSHELHN